MPQRPFSGMHTEVIRGITVRPLRSGEAGVVQAVFDRLGPRSRLLRFGGAKSVLTAADLRELSRVDERHHVLVASIDGEPVGIARLVRDGPEAEVAVAVGDGGSAAASAACSPTASPPTRAPRASSRCARRCTRRTARRLH